MDNLTHSLIGLVAGDSIARARSHPGGGLPADIRRNWFVTLSVVGGNLPDLDLLYSFHPLSHDSDAKLDYVLQHRGYTHTLICCVLLALLLYAATEVWARCRKLRLTRHDRGMLAAVCLFATLLHLGMDFLNSYGVHPFWPVRNEWRYGDSVFIVEPLYWLAAAPLLFSLRTSSARIFVGLVLLAAPLVCFASHRVLPGWCVGFALAMVALLTFGYRLAARTAAFTGAALMLAVTCGFVLAGRHAARAAVAVATEFPGERLIDHVLTPAPLNPLCWDMLLLQTRGDRYVARHAVLSNAPAWLPAARCPMRTAGAEALSTQPLPADSAQVHWLGETELSRALLIRLVAQHCQAAALMQFARAPFVEEREQHWVLGDLRFDRAGKGGMTDIELGSTRLEHCPAAVPWVPPRQDLLGGEARESNPEDTHDQLL